MNSGRVPSVVVVLAALQDPRKEVLPIGIGERVAGAMATGVQTAVEPVTR